MKIPEKVPAKGFYYHYKHDPSGPVNNYAYEVVGVGHHTENEDMNMVVYRPLYDSFVYKAGKMFDLRPIYMFMEEVSKNGQVFPRFKMITDPKILLELDKTKKEMYGEN